MGFTKLTHYRVTLE